MTRQDRALLIHYPSGGFGHFLYAVLTICGSQFHAWDDKIEFSDTGDSHKVRLNSKVWFHMSPDYQFSVEDWADTDEKRHIVLIDSGINLDEYQVVRNRFPNNQMIRMCIDPVAVPIVRQTCLYKAERKIEFEFKSKLDWEQREEISLSYWHALSQPDFYLNNFKPVYDQNVLNIPISWLVFQFDLVIDQLNHSLGLELDRNKARELHAEFMLHNEKYTRSTTLWRDISAALDQNINLELPDNISLHDQGYINFMLEVNYELEEISAWDYRDWFRSTSEIAQAIKKLKSQIT
jgi:hypothetical protein